MKRTIAAIATTVLLAAGAGATYAVAAGAAGVPEVDEANATIQLSPSRFAVSPVCPGEDGTSYVTYTGSWHGIENDLSFTTDYGLTGKLSVSKVVWTINLKTLRGVLTGTASFVGVPPPAGIPGDAAPATYKGTLTLVTQGLPDSTAANGAQARGWIKATLNNLAAPVPNSGTLLANVEMTIAPSLVATGEFGNQTMGFNDISVATNNQAC
jgi:hypothetical protein